MLLRFEPTYEELKQVEHFQVATQLPLFWAYLWGIETWYKRESFSNKA